jgi:CRISPR/Cas system CMR-associated protein Cmr5 small subunit
MNMTQSSQQTLQQKRAQHAYGKVKALDERTTQVKEYGSLVRGLPAQIQIDEGQGLSSCRLPSP